jgi:hypothetical protein
MSFLQERIPDPAAELAGYEHFHSTPHPAAAFPHAHRTQ